MMDMLIYWAPVLLIFFGMIILGLVKHDNKKLLAGVLAWGLFPVFVWLYVMAATAIFGGDPCP